MKDGGVGRAFLKGNELKGLRLCPPIHHPGKGGEEGKQRKRLFRCKADAIPGIKGWEKQAFKTKQVCPPQVVRGSTRRGRGR